MDNSENTNSFLNTSFLGGGETSLCEILVIIFIAALIYYIFYDSNLSRPNKVKPEGFKTEPFVNMEDEDIGEIKKVTFENDMPENISAEYTPEIVPEDHPLLNDIENDTAYEDILVSKPKKSKKTKKVKRSSGISPSDLTGGDRSLLLMNENARQRPKNYSCNLLGLNSNDMDDFKKNFYGMYAHQIECPKNCYMNRFGMKKCDLESDKDCNGVFTTDYNNPDVYALNYMALLNNNEKPCVTCTEKPTLSLKDSTQLRQTMFASDETSPHLSEAGLSSVGTRQNSEEKFEMLPNRMEMEDRERLQKMKVTNANLSNYVNFEDNVNLNSIGETQVDKLAQFRSSCATGTCGLKDFGKSIKNVYDNLLSTPAYKERKACDPYQLTGINENLPLGDEYATYNKYN